MSLILDMIQRQGLGNRAKGIIGEASDAMGLSGGQVMPTQVMPMPEPMPAPAPAPELAQMKAADTMVRQAIENPELRKDPSFIERGKKFFGNKENALRLAMAFNTLRDKPDAGLQSMLAKEMQGIRATKASSVTSQRIAQQLRNMGDEAAARIVESNPAMANEVLKQVLQKRYSTTASKEFAPRVDPVTGQLYIVRDGKRVNVEGATDLTAQQRAQLQVDSELQQADKRRAQDAAATVYGRAGQVDSQISRLRSAKSKLKKGASTGWIRQFLPAMDAATAELRAIGNQLGIDIINSATFGALSEKELSLALSTGLPTGLGEEELIEYINNKIAAQEKLRDQLMKDARELSSGMGYNAYIQSRTTEKRQEAIPDYSVTTDTEGFEVLD